MKKNVLRLVLKQGGKGCDGERKEENLDLRSRDSCNKISNDESHFNVLFSVRDKVT